MEPHITVFGEHREGASRAVRGPAGWGEYELPTFLSENGADGPREHMFVGDDR